MKKQYRLLLLKKYAGYDLLITNTVFNLPNQNKTSWMHHRSKYWYWHFIDYVIRHVHHVRISSNGTNGLNEWYWEKAAQDRTKWRWYINKAATQFEANEICEAKRKCKEREAIANGPSEDSAQSELTCAFCKRQFGANICLNRHQ